MRLSQAFFKPSHPCLVGGRQQREFPKEILQDKQVGVRGQQREFPKEILQAKQAGDTTK